MAEIPFDSSLSLLDGMGKTSSSSGEVSELKNNEKAGSRPGAFDATPVDLSSMSEAEKIITGVGAEQSIEQDQARVEPTENDRTESQAPQTPDQLVAPIIVIQQATPTTPRSIQYPAAIITATMGTHLEPGTFNIITPAQHEPITTHRKKKSQPRRSDYLPKQIV
ncbi:hypothetical protein KCU67_g12112, partial [Aureobasidium melanogenum]